jgi:hypothetical protein
VAFHNRGIREPAGGVIMRIMHKVMAPAALLFLSTIVVSAQQPQAPLPDVDVTAQAPIKQVNPFQPFSGNTRVDEARWPVIPCASSRIDLGPGSKCQTGTQIETFLTMSQGGRCDIARQVAMVDNARYRIEADVMIFDPTKVTATGHQGKNCTVWTGYTNMPDDFQDMNQMTRRGTGWRNFVKGNPQSTIEYTDGGRNCLAFERLGPPWHGGYVWVVHASICPVTPATLQNGDIDAVFAAAPVRRPGQSARTGAIGRRPRAEPLTF